jgi:anti-anti-sigma factor
MAYPHHAVMPISSFGNFAGVLGEGGFCYTGMKLGSRVASPDFRPRDPIMAVIKSEIQGEIRVIFLDAPRLVDEAIIEQCHREILELLNKTEEKLMLLHFGRVAFMSSTALGMLVRVHKKCKEFEVSLKMCNISPDIHKVFKITGLDKVFGIYADAAGAMEAFKASGQLSFRPGREARHELK